MNLPIGLLTQLKNYNMKTLYNYINEGSLLGGIDNVLADGDEAPRKLVQKFLEDNYKGNWIISEKPNKDGLYEVSSNERINAKSANITSLANDLFIWTSVKGDFYCAYSKKLKSLEGAPKEVGGYFYCSYCNELESLEGAPEEVGKGFSCSNCKSLTSLEGAPEKIGGYFDCSNCKSLKNLKGAPKEVGEDFHCTDCGIPFTPIYAKKFSKIKGKIYC